MTTTIAILADLHLPSAAGTAQEAALDWALECLRAEAPDVVVFGGDITASGTAVAARRAREKVEACGIPFRMAAGNSDRRTPEEWAAVRDLLTVADDFSNNDCLIHVVETTEETLSQAARDALVRSSRSAGDRHMVIISHFGPASLRAGDREWLETFLAGQRSKLLIAGHTHRDHGSEDQSVHTVRGLDPDKAIGGPPAIAAFRLEDGEWSRSEIPFPGGRIKSWTAEERRGFLERLGFSCMSETLDGLGEAAAMGVRTLEVRAYDTLKTDRRRLLAAVERWREAGGTTLSFHMPSLKWEDGNVTAASIAEWEASNVLALAIGADRLTIHVPQAPVAEMRPEEPAWRAISEHHCELLDPVLERGMVVSVENLHMRAGEPSDDSRRFGCLPDECLTWIRHLRNATGSANIGFHLDLGHARNNPPFSKRLPLGEWYALTGREISGYHLHQVRDTPDGLKNHNPLDSLFGPLISLNSFLWAWQRGQIAHAPLFLEIRGKGEGPRCWTKLRSFFELR